MKPDRTLQSNILIRLLKTISEDEWKEFEKFAASPYFNKGRNYIHLLKILKKFHPQFDSEDLTKENIYKKLYPGKEYKESVLNSMFSRLYSIGEEYLVQHALNNNDNMIKEKLMLSELLSRGDKLKADNLIEENMNYFNNKKFGIRDFHNLRELKLEIHKLVHTKYEEEKLNDSIMEILSVTLNSFFFDLHFYKGIIYSQKNFWEEDFEKTYIFRIIECIDLEKIMEIIKKNEKNNFIPLHIYYLSYKAVKYIDNDELYFELKSYFFKHFDRFDIKFKIIIMKNLWRLCSIKSVRGNREFVMETFEIRKKMAEEDLLTGTDQYMQPSEFRSTLIDALNVNKLEWAKKFAENNIKKLHPEFRKDIENYSKAFLAYPEGDYDKAVEFASKLNINQIIFKFDMKNMLSKVYYETGSTEPLVSMLNSYYQLINNYGKKDNGFSIRHKNFILYLRKLSSLKENKGGRVEFELLKKNIEKDNVNSKSWLMKKIEEMIN